MKKLLDRASLWKSLLFILVFHGLAVVGMFLHLEQVMSDAVWFFGELLLGVIAVPAYFFVKGNATKFWLYALLILAEHILATVLGFLILPCFFTGWNTAIVYFTEIFLHVTVALILLIDGIIRIVSC